MKRVKTAAPATMSSHDLLPSPGNKASPDVRASQDITPSHDIIACVDIAASPGLSASPAVILRCSSDALQAASRARVPCLKGRYGFVQRPQPESSVPEN